MSNLYNLPIPQTHTYRNYNTEITVLWQGQSKVNIYTVKTSNIETEFVPFSAEKRAKLENNFQSLLMSFLIKLNDLFMYKIIKFAPST